MVYTGTEHFGFDADAQAEREDLTDSVILYAINTGEFYRTHCAMATEGASINRWCYWVRYTVMPEYRREIGEAVLRRNMVIVIASALREYYTNHIKEMPI